MLLRLLVLIFIFLCVDISAITLRQLEPGASVSLSPALPISGISELYGFGYGAALQGTVSSIKIPFLRSGLEMGYYHFTGAAENFASSADIIPIQLMAELFLPFALPLFPRFLSDWQMLPFARLSGGLSYVATSAGGQSYGNFETTFGLAAGASFWQKSRQKLRYNLDFRFLGIFEERSALFLMVGVGAAYFF